MVYVPQLRAARQPLTIDLLVFRRGHDEGVGLRAYELHALPNGVAFAVIEACSAESMPVAL